MAQVKPAIITTSRSVSFDLPNTLKTDLLQLEIRWNPGGSQGLFLGVIEYQVLDKDDNVLSELTCLPSPSTGKGAEIGLGQVTLLRTATMEKENVPETCTSKADIATADAAYVEGKIKITGFGKMDGSVFEYLAIKTGGATLEFFTVPVNGNGKLEIEIPFTS